MKYFDFSTVYTAILTCNILIAIIAVIIRNEKIMINVGYKLITVFLLLTAIRFLLPFEVSYATTIPLPEGIFGVIVKVFTPLFYIHGHKFKLLHLILLIWLVGILVQGYRYYRANRRIYTYIFTHGKNVTNDSVYAELLAEISPSTHHKFHIYEISFLRTPLLYGHRIPYILLPADYCAAGDRTNKNVRNDLSYILKHEVMHYRHHDLFIKFMVRLLSIIYWWNPFCYLLNEQIDLVLEMRIDDTVTPLSDKEISEYLHTLLNIAEYQDAVLSHPMGNVISFAHGNHKVLTKRFQMLLHRKHKKNKGLNLFLIFVVGIIYLCSYLFIFEAYHVSEEAIELSVQASDTNSFLVDNGDGTYDFYFNNIRFEVVDSLDYYSEDIPIYTREEFEHVQKDNPE